MRLAAVLLVPATLLAAGVLAGTPAADRAQNPECVRWRSEVRYRNAGYDHVVILQNACDAPAVCTVTTNVNPDPISAQVAPGQVTEVLTFRGSPASTFDARVQCALEAGTRN